MPLKNILIVVKNIQISADFYMQIFGMRILRQFDGKIILAGGLVLQDKMIWEDYIGRKVLPYNQASLLYFDVDNIIAFENKLKLCYPDIEYLSQLLELPNGRKFLRFYDPDGNLIEVGENTV